MIKIYTNDEPAETKDAEWTDVVEVPGSQLPAKLVTIINEGDFAGFWRLVDSTGKESPAVRLPCGGGEPGERRAGFNFPCPGFNGKLQVRRAGVVAGNLTGIWGVFTG